MTSRNLDGQVVLVTGAARGIGREVALAFAHEGAHVAGLDLAGRASAAQDYALPTPDDLAETGRLVEAEGVRFLPLLADLRDLPALRDACARTERELGPIAVLAAVAGIQTFRPLLEMEDADWHDQIDVNLTGTANTLRAVAPLMAARRAGRIIVTSSTQSRHGMRDGSAYSASKWGLFGLMKSAALELGEFGITVNAVVPGLIDTPLTRHRSRYAQALKEAKGRVPDGDLEQQVAQAKAASTPLGVPWVAPQDVAPAYVFLASAAARMVTGTSLDVTGGDSAHLPD